MNYSDHAMRVLKLDENDGGVGDQTEETWMLI